MSRRAPLIALVLAVLGGAALLLTRAGDNPRYDHHSLGVSPVQGIATLKPGGELCQTPVGLPHAIDRVVLQFGFPQTKDPDAGRVEYTIRKGGRYGEVLARKTLERGLMIGAPAGFVLPTKVAGGQDVAICLRTLDVPVDVFGDVDVSIVGPPPRFANRVTVNPTQSASAAFLNGENLGADLFMNFPRAEPSTMLAQIPNGIEHMSVFKFSEPWLVWLLIALAVIGGPVAMGRALVAALRDDAGEPEA